MIDVRFVVGQGLWILGSALALSAFSYFRWMAKQRPRELREVVEHRSWKISPASGLVSAASGFGRALGWRQDEAVTIGESGATLIPEGHSPIARIARLIGATELPLVLAIAPLLLFPTPTRLLVLLLVPPVWIGARVATGRYLPSTPLNIPLALLLTMVGVSVWATSDILLSLGKVSGLLLGILLFWGVVRWIVTPARLTIGTVVFVLMGAVLAVIGVLGTNWVNKFQLFNPLTAMLPKMIRGIPGADDGFNPNAVAGGLVLFIPLQAVLLFSGASDWMLVSRRSLLVRGAVAAVQLSLLLLTSGAILLMQSRGAWFGLAVAAVAILIWHARRTRLLTLAGVGVAAMAFGPAVVSGVMVGEPGAAHLNGIVERIEIWSGALRGIQEFALTGMGMNTFRKMVPLLTPTLVANPAANIPTHAHNHLLQAALDLGLPGLIAYTSIWLLTAFLLVTAYRRSMDAKLRAVAAGLGGGLIAHFVFGFTDVIPLGAKVGVLFWLDIGLAVACYHLCFPPRRV